MRHALYSEQLHGVQDGPLGHVVEVHAEDQVIDAQGVDEGLKPLDAFLGRADDEAVATRRRRIPSRLRFVGD